MDLNLTSSAKRSYNVQFGSGNAESHWRRGAKRYRPVMRRWDDGHVFPDTAFKLSRVVRTTVPYRRGNTLKKLLAAGNFNNAENRPKANKFDVRILEMGAQYDILVDDDVNLCLFEATESVNSIDIVRFFDSIRFTHCGPIELLALAAGSPDKVPSSLVGLDYTARNPDVDHTVLVLMSKESGLHASLSSTLRTKWNAGTCFGGMDKNFVDPMPYED